MPLTKLGRRSPCVSIVCLNSGDNSSLSSRTLIESFDSIRCSIRSFEIFADVNECIRFLRQVENESIQFILDDSIDQEDLRLIHVIETTDQIRAVYVLSNGSTDENTSLQQMNKFKGSFDRIEDISSRVKEDITQHTKNCFKTSIVSAKSSDLNVIDLSYIYVKLLVDILYRKTYDLSIELESFAEFVKQRYPDDATKAKDIEQFQKFYHLRTPLWWYSRESCFFQILNKALYTYDYVAIVKMGFFLQGLHREISEAYEKADHSYKLTVYRGHTMTLEQFEQIKQQKGGLFVFHNLLSTTVQQATALRYVDVPREDTDTVGILFRVDFDPKHCSIPFTSVDSKSFYGAGEEEIIFSANTLFRIDDIGEFKNRLWIINLSAIADEDEPLKFFHEYLKDEIYSIHPMNSIAMLLHKAMLSRQAKEIFQHTLSTLTDEDNVYFNQVFTSVYNNLGVIDASMDDHEGAQSWYENALDNHQKTMPLEQGPLARISNNLAMEYYSIGDYAKASAHCERSLAIKTISISTSPASLIVTYSNLGKICEAKGDYSDALSYYRQAQKIQKSAFPLDHPSITTIYNNLAGIYCLIADYPTALAFYEKSLEIYNTFLLPHDRSRGTAHNNIGYVYQLMGDYRAAIFCYEEAEKLLKRFAESNDSSLAITYNNLGSVYRLIGDYETAMSYYNKVKEIQEKSSISNPLRTAATYNNFAVLLQEMGENSLALDYYEKIVRIWDEKLSPNHPSLATLHNNMGYLYDSMKDSNKALFHYNKSIEILQDSLMNNPLDLANTYNNMGELYRVAGDYERALSFYEKTLDIEEKCLSNNHSSLAITLTNMAVALNGSQQYQQAISYAQRAVDILSSTLGFDHAQTQMNQRYLDELCQQTNRVENTTEIISST